jgi:hypothetical protein
MRSNILVIISGACFFDVAAIKPKASGMLGKYSTTKLYPSPGIPRPFITVDRKQ